MNHMLKSALGAGLAAAVTAGLTACGGSSSSSGSSASTVSVTGVVTDPAISGAQVRIDNSAGNALASVVVTDDNGAFSFSGISASALDGAVITASGGEDAETGVDFTGLQLKGIYQDDGSAEVVTPLTTLIVEEMEASGSDYASARATVATLLGLEESQLEADPDTDSAVQKLSLQLSLLGAALRAADGFDHVYELLENENGTDWTAISSYVQASDDYSDTIKERVAELEEELTAIGSISSSLSAAELVTEANRLSMIAGVKKFFSESLSYEPAEDSAGDINLIALARALWQVNEQNGLPTDSVGYQNMIRYVMDTYSITTTDLDDSEWAVPNALYLDARIIVKANITAIDHTVALAEGEYLSTSEEKRDYFYASDLAPAYKALELFDGVSDDNIVDPAFVKIAATYAAQGMLDEADVILNSQIAMPFYQAKANLRVGSAIYDLEGLAAAKVYWDKSAELLSAYMTDKGYLNLDQEDATLISSLAAVYRDNGYSDTADTIVQPINDFITANSGSYSGAYFVLTFSFSSQADELVTAAEEDGLSTTAVNAAKEAVDLYADVVEGIGAQTGKCEDGSGYYKARVYSYPTIAEYYMRLGLSTEVEETITTFETTRTLGCTAEQTEAYVNDMAPAYGYVNRISDYISMVNSTVSTESHINDSLSAAAIYQAMELAKTANEGEEDNVANAIAIVTELYPDDTNADDLVSRVTYLTNNGINETDGGAYLALKLFKDGYTEEGAQVLTAAWDIASSEAYINASADDGSQLMHTGCSKIARMTYQYVDQTLGQSRMQICASIAEGFESTGTTAAISAAYSYLSQDALLADLDDLGVSSYHSAISYADLLSGEDAIEMVRLALNYPVEAGLLSAGATTDDLTSPLTSLKTEFSTAVSAAASDDELKDAGYIALSILGAYGDAVKGLREAAEQNGPFANQAGEVNALQTEAAALLQELYNLAISLSSAEDTDDLIKLVYGIGQTYFIENIGIFAALADLIESMDGHVSDSDIDNYRAYLTSDIMESDAFPSSAEASVDADNDGLPDFYAATATADEISSSSLTEDTDVDGDGTDDSMDATPFYAEI